jgi:dipeptidyl aminopeptidase/acylaminoacyl peptidase
MSPIRFRWLLLAALVCPALSAQYLLPPKEVIEAFDAKPLPDAILSPSRQVLALTYRKAQPTIAELSQSMLRLAGERINPKTFGPHRNPLIYAITLKKIDGGAETKVTVPENANISNVRFSHDGSKMSFVNTRPDGIDLWIANVATGKATLAASHLNATSGDPCDWLPDNATLVCKVVPMGRGPAPAEPAVPSGPNVQVNEGKTAQAATYEDMIRTSHDEDLFEYYFSSQLALVHAGGAPRTIITKPVIFAQVTPSPSGAYILVTKIKRPFSHLIPMFGFPQDIEVLDKKGAVVKTLAQQPSQEGVPLAGVETGPRAFRWRMDQPATLVWAEALDGGDS